MHNYVTNQSSPVTLQPWNFHIEGLARQRSSLPWSSGHFFLSPMALAMSWTGAFEEQVESKPLKNKMQNRIHVRPGLDKTW